VGVGGLYRAWILLAVVVSIARSSGSLVAVYTLLVFAGYVAVMVVVLRPILSWLSKHVAPLPSSLPDFRFALCARMIRS
jgi:Kef-type K+ transport system membrane component KefB